MRYLDNTFTKKVNKKMIIIIIIKTKTTIIIINKGDRKTVLFFTITIPDRSTIFPIISQHNLIL